MCVVTTRLSPESARSRRPVGGRDTASGETNGVIFYRAQKCRLKSRRDDVGRIITRSGEERRRTASGIDK